MAVNSDEVVRLYREKHLTMQQVGDRVGVTKARVQQILKAAGVETGHRYRPRPQKKGSRPAKAYRAYLFSRETRELVERLAAHFEESRTRVVVRAIEELAAWVLPDDAGAAKAGQGGTTGGRSKRPQKGPG